MNAVLSRDPTNRLLRTLVDGLVVDKAKFTLGVSTGSVFGPIKYIMHVNCDIMT